MAIVAMVNNTALGLLSPYNVSASAADDFCPGNRTFLIGNDLSEVGRVRQDAEMTYRPQYDEDVNCRFSRW